jgi:hypothetical protein
MVLLVTRTNSVPVRWRAAGLFPPIRDYLKSTIVITIRCTIIINVLFRHVKTVLNVLYFIRTELWCSA